MRKSSIALFLSIFCCVFANAQDFRTSYFLSNYLYDYRINPASLGDSYDNSFISVGIGDVNVGGQATFPMNAFIWKEDGSYNFGVNKNFSLEKLHDIFPTFSKANFSISENVFAMGWKRGYNAGMLEVNLRSYSSAYFDFDLVKMGYNGPDGLPYSLQNTKMNTRNWLEVAYGFKNSISDNFSFGARIKGLIGLNYSNLDVYSLYSDYQGSSIVAYGDGTFTSTNTFLKFPQNGSLISLQPEFGRYMIGGFGAAADLGLKIQTSRDIEITVAVLDLGGLMWRNKLFGEPRNTPSLDSFEDIYKIDELEPESSMSFVMNPVTVEAGARYPISENLSAGTLATIRIDKTARGWYEIRVGGAFTPAPAFSIAASAAMNTLGAGLGLAMNLRVPGVAFSVGTDSLFGLFCLNEDSVPARKFNSNIHAGLSVAW